MLRSSLALAAAVVVLGACGADTATQETEPPPPYAPGAPATSGTESAGRSEDGGAAVAVPENAEDRAIRRELNSALAQEPHLKDREISFLVSNGDVSVTGTVGSEDERRKFNDIAMGITGVKSVANALRVEE